MASYLIDLTSYPELESDLKDIVREMKLLGKEISIPDLIVRLASGHRVNEIVEFERSIAEK